MGPGLNEAPSFDWRRRLPENIYHQTDQGHLEPMVEEAFALEDTLQELVAHHPELLSGEQMDPNDPRRWILVGREQGIADIVGGGHRWALDHLLIDQDAIPTLVEAKRSASSEIRRSIIGQMMEYAAHATRTWNVGDIRQAFENAMGAEGRDPDDVLADLLQTYGELDANEFWQRVETNLRAARLRLLFVADGIPDELTRVVEFMNEQMPGIEVLAVEIKQFRGAAGRTLVPRVIGRTAAPGKSLTSGRRRTNRDEFLNRIPSTVVKQAANRLLDVAIECGAQLSWGNVGVSIRCRTSALPRPLTVAWLFPTPAPHGSAGNTNFRFGAGNWTPEFFTKLPENLRDLLESWGSLPQGHSFAWDVSAPGHKAWALSHEDAATNIDALSERLENVILSLQQLQPTQE